MRPLPRLLLALGLAPLLTLSACSLFGGDDDHHHEDEEFCLSNPELCEDVRPAPQDAPATEATPEAPAEAAR